MSSHLGQSFVLHCGLQGDLVLSKAIGGAASAVSCVSSSGASSSGLGLAMCTGGHGIGFRNGQRCVRVRCSGRSGREAAGAREEEVELSTSGLSRCGDDGVSREKKWMVAALAAMVVVGGAAAGEPAMAFGWFGSPEVEKDPVEPFTIYGSILKKYLIEDVVENKVVGRRKGFTASACVNALDASKETPELQGVPAGLKVTIIGEPACAKGQGQTREESCAAPCKKACQGAVTRHLTEVKEETGYVLDESDIKKVTENCSLQCFNECTKPGKSISFVFPFRPH
ncbi:hypothetical protein KC19_2G017600 [Ceratodon purpureus]|uniref:Uncharacterized protein n=1 Tax=Ceratodon purpureus TaxID=3225 RepID=A0A8T0IS66_CERPU|nr:hypothetical protein KC19_2G017600 [Ceratodon purpureus]